MKYNEVKFVMNYDNKRIVKEPRDFPNKSYGNYLKEKSNSGSTMLETVPHSSVGSMELVQQMEKTSEVQKSGVSLLETQSYSNIKEVRLVRKMIGVGKKEFTGVSIMVTTDARIKTRTVGDYKRMCKMILLRGIYNSSFGIPTRSRLQEVGEYFSLSYENVYKIATGGEYYPRIVIKNPENSVMVSSLLH